MLARCMKRETKTNILLKMCKVKEGMLFKRQTQESAYQ